MKLHRLTYGVIATIAIFCSCVKPFNPAVTTVNQNILVVEGFINTGGDTTKINVSHTVTIGNKNSSVAESGATVTVEDAAGTSYVVPETAIKGSYASKGALAIISGKQYRLRIKTTGGKTYLSDLVDVKVAPPIDSLGYSFKSDGIQFYINAHDNSGQSIYYKYGFSEAWIFHAKTQSDFISNGINDAIPRTAAQNIYFCYGTDSVTSTLINSTAALSKDVVFQFPINELSDTSEKLQQRYTILASQQVLTKAGYAFWQNLKKNTEQLGSIFDAQPSAISGNIHNINNIGEPVIGFISAGTIQTKRIYIDKKNLPSNYAAGYPYSCHAPDTAINTNSTPIPGAPAYPPWAYPTVIVQPQNNRITGTNGLKAGAEEVYYTSPECADCTIRGTVKAPTFWKP